MRGGTVSYKMRKKKKGKNQKKEKEARRPWYMVRESCVNCGANGYHDIRDCKICKTGGDHTCGICSNWDFRFNLGPCGGRAY